MIGDGFNDAASMAKSDVAISMGNGSDVAIENSSVIILNDKLQNIITTLKISALTLKTIQQNLFWAFIYNIFAIPIAGGVFYFYNGFQLSPSIASIAMVLSSITVVLNSLWLKYKKVI